MLEDKNIGEVRRKKYKGRLGGARQEKEKRRKLGVWGEEAERRREQDEEGDRINLCKKEGVKELEKENCGKMLKGLFRKRGKEGFGKISEETMKRKEKLKKWSENVRDI